jgi:hypothetical protein
MWLKSDCFLTVHGWQSILLCFFILTQLFVALLINSHALINYRMLHFPDLLCCGNIFGFLKVLQIPRSPEHTHIKNLNMVQQIYFNLKLEESLMKPTEA